MMYLTKFLQWVSRIRFILLGFLCMAPSSDVFDYVCCNLNFKSVVFDRFICMRCPKCAVVYKVLQEGPGFVVLHEVFCIMGSKVMYFTRFFCMGLPKSVVLEDGFIMECSHLLYVVWFMVRGASKVM